jgi:ribosome modulation factor
MQYSPFLRSDLREAFDKGKQDYFNNKNGTCPYEDSDKKEAWFDGQVMAASGQDIIAKRAIAPN